MSDEQPLTEPVSEDEISEVARKRREAAERDSAIPRPSYVTNVEHSEVIYTFDPSAMPLTHVDPAALVSSMTALFGVSLEPLDISPLLDKVPRDQLLGMDEAELLRRLVRTPPSVIRFGAGKFPLRNDFVPIRSIDMNWESIVVRVGGVTSVAEAVAQDSLELLWKLAGSPKRWNDVSSMILLQGFGTATRVSFDAKTERFIEPRIVRTFRENMSDGKRLVTRMGVFKPSMLDSEEVIASVFFDDLTLLVSKFSPTTGSSYQSEVRISVTAKNDYGTGRLRITSELDFDDHMALLELLSTALSDGS